MNVLEFQVILVQNFSSYNYMGFTLWGHRHEVVPFMDATPEIVKNAGSEQAAERMLSAQPRKEPWVRATGA